MSHLSCSTHAADMGLPVCKYDTTHCQTPQHFSACCPWLPYGHRTDPRPLQSLLAAPLRKAACSYHWQAHRAPCRALHPILLVLTTGLPALPSGLPAASSLLVSFVTGQAVNTFWCNNAACTSQSCELWVTVYWSAGHLRCPASKHDVTPEAASCHAYVVVLLPQIAKLPQGVTIS